MPTLDWLDRQAAFSVATKTATSATMFITAFELLKDCIVDRVRDFYTLG
jgi:hypothetical protein